MSHLSILLSRGLLAARTVIVPRSGCGNIVTVTRLRILIALSNLREVSEAG